MKITFQRHSDKDKFVKFNSDSFPERVRFNQKLIDFRYFNPLHPGDFVQNNVLAIDENDTIAAQAVYHPANYYFEDERRAMEWGFDLFVRADKRNDALGIELLEFVRDNKTTPIFASGVGEKALKIEKFFGYHVIGYLKKYFKLVNPLYLISGLLAPRCIKTAHFPTQVGRGDELFDKVTFTDLWDANEPYNSDVIEFERDKTFLKWRFYSDNFHYAVYRLRPDDSAEPCYFAVRTVKFKNITILVLVDYRYDFESPRKMESIINAASKVASKLLLPMIVTGSSHHITDRQLEKQKFKITGKDRPIISNKKEYKQHKQKIEARDFIFSTLADSDGEYLM